MSNREDPPFHITYDSNVPDLLKKLNCSIAVSTYQTGKLIFICPAGPGKLVQIPKHFKKPMGIAVKGDKLAVATLHSVMVFKNSPELAKSFPLRPDVYDALFMPRAVYFTGTIDVHDLHWGKRGLIAINTVFSCISLINEEHSFKPVWKPEFITELWPEDRCHLNGVAMVDGVATYATALSSDDTKRGWRKNIAETGVLMELKSQKIVLDGLPMPHSPRVYDGKLFILLSATGELAVFDLKYKQLSTVKLPGFARGMAEHGDYIFIALSKIRTNSKLFMQLPVKDRASHAGVVIIYKPTLAIVGSITYTKSVQEIYDVQVFPNMLTPTILTQENDVHERSISVPNLNFWRKEGKKTN